MNKRFFILATFMMLCSLFFLSACSSQSDNRASERSYSHVDFTSSIEKDRCLLCGDSAEHEINTYLEQDNVGLVNVNTFDVLRLEINRYDHSGQLVEEATGSTQMGLCEVGNTKTYVISDIDRGYAHVEITPSSDKIDAEAIGSYLCDECLDDFSSKYFDDEVPSEIAVVNFTTREIRPLVSSCPWFTFDNYLVDCTFEDDGDIDLRVTYRPLRYQE